ncbi:MAG: saccharopine dehydrogenase [Parcubacteria group bacterium Gr01-1014_3]|nr:MAG: saccharopine dehydrogenase [Parcubacteria group bacterium Gr01-1014_3]
MKFDFLVLGATGMQGRIVTADLIGKGYKVFGSSRHAKGLEKVQEQHPTFQFEELDLSDSKKIAELISRVNPGVVINCAEGDWNFEVYQAALEAGANVIDLGSDIPTTQKQMALDQAFKEKGLTAITGCGSTPGVNDVMLRYASGFLDTIDTIEAGFAWNSEPQTFVVPFSMESIFEEFTDPAQVFENGEWGVKVPMETVQDKEFREVGNQKVFLVRHPETYTFYYYFQDLGVKTVRFYAGFPDHSFNVIQDYIKRGLTKDRKFCLDGENCAPLTALTKILQEKHAPPEGYEEKENLWVSLTGTKNGRKETILMECIVPTLPDWKSAGCNIDTGFPASIMAQMILNKVVADRGSFAPAGIIPPEPFFEELKKRSMRIYMNGAQIV